MRFDLDIFKVLHLGPKKTLKHMYRMWDTVFNSCVCGQAAEVSVFNELDTYQLQILFVSNASCNVELH